MLKKLFFCILLLQVCLYAAPAFNNVTTFKNADGSTFQGKLQGDEWLNWVELDNGYVAKYSDENKQYEYGTIQTKENSKELLPSGIKVEQNLHAPSKSAIQGLSSQSNHPFNTIKPINATELKELWKEKRKNTLQN